jgi:UDP-xylose/UDP-N-acetylglucosamine transporter B4
VTIQTASTQITFEQRLKDGKVVRSWIPRLRPRVVPLRRWLVQVVLFLAVSLLNNFAFSFKVSPLGT